MTILASQIFWLAVAPLQHLRGVCTLGMLCLSRLVIVDNLVAVGQMARAREFPKKKLVALRRCGPVLRLGVFYMDDCYRNTPFFPTPTPKSMLNFAPCQTVRAHMEPANGHAEKMISYARDNIVRLAYTLWYHVESSARIVHETQTFYNATLCVSTVFVVARCLSVCLCD